MRGLVTGFLVPAVLSLAVGAGVLAVGTGLAQVPESRSALVRTAPEGCYDAPISPVAQAGVGGGVRLCIDGDGVTATMEAENLSVGETYTLWFTYIDQDRRMSEADFGAPAHDRPSAVAGQLESRVVSAREATFSGTIADLRPAARSEITLTLFQRESRSAATRWGPARQLVVRSPSAQGTPSEAGTADGEAGAPVARAVIKLEPRLRPGPR